MQKAIEIIKIITDEINIILYYGLPKDGIYYINYFTDPYAIIKVYKEIIFNLQGNIGN